MNEPAADVTALILAGGAGRRRGGADKGLLEHRGVPLVAQVVAALSPQVGQVLISCNRNRARYAEFGDLAPPDSRTDFQGPLAGLEAVAGTLDAPYLLVVPCDTPALPADLCQRLISPLRNNPELQATWANDGEREQYLCCALRREALSTVTNYLDSGQRAVRHWLGALPHEEIDFSDRPGCFANLNRPEPAKTSWRESPAPPRE